MSLQNTPKTIVIILNSHMYQSRFKAQVHDHSLIIGRTMDKRITPYPILPNGPKYSQYGVSLRAKDNDVGIPWALEKYYDPHS